MKLTLLHFLAAGLLLAAASNAFAATQYVDLNSASPTPPYTTWSTAATTIQDAVDAAAAGDEIVVTNGVYTTGGRAVYGTMMNRVAVTKPVMVRSVNGPGLTVIRGYQVPGTTNGDGAVRCAYLADGATLVGFTLTCGATRSSGFYSGDIAGTVGGGVWCAAVSAVVSNCVLSGNSAGDGGAGACGGTLKNCTLSGNSAALGPGSGGGGALNSSLGNCTLSGNSADFGGGASGGTLSNCVLSGNLAYEDGGGGHGGVLSNCALSGNSARFRGGGAYFGTLNNCVLSGNSARNGGGAHGAELSNCILSGNSARLEGGGADEGTLNNCIVYYNVAPLGVNYSEEFTSLNYCCTTPAPPAGVSNLTAEPQLTSVSHPSVGSPCRGAGDPAYASGLDIDGEPWANRPSIGCDEFYPGGQVGRLTVAIQAGPTNVAAGFEANFLAEIAGNPSASVWDFGDGTVVSNRPYAAHVWEAAGHYPVVLRSYNQSFPNGVSATVTVQVVAQPVHYVAVGSTNPVAPYGSWATAASTIQDAVDAARVAGALVLVSKGTYQTGARVVSGAMSNRVAVTFPLTLRSVDGPEMTVIRGYQVPVRVTGDAAVRCVYLTNGATLEGFTLTDGATRDRGDPDLELSGGGVCCESAGAVLSNCVLRSNAADYQGGGDFGGRLNRCTLTANIAGRGGGASACGLDNCVLSGNSDGLGGGAYNASLKNCTVSGNRGEGGGVFHCTLYNCVLSTNSSGNYGGGARDSTLSNCTLIGNLADQSGGGAYQSVLINCTLMANVAPGGGGAADSVLTNCTLAGNRAPSVGGGAYSGTLNDCVLRGNSADFGGGASHSTLSNCVLSGNSARFDGGGAIAGTLNNCTLNENRAGQYGGGVLDTVASNCQLFQNFALSGGGAYSDGSLPCVLSNCTLVANSATNAGGGASGATLNNCTLSGNSAQDGGGAYGGELNDCTLTANSATNAGGGASSATLNNCILSGNSADSGGGAFLGTLNNCTVTGNSALSGGGVIGLSNGGVAPPIYAVLNNCIVYYNTTQNAPANYRPSDTILNYCCTTPQPTNGVGNITNAPLFVDQQAGNLHLQSNSPCINAGNNAYVSAPTDIDSRPRIVGGTVDIGAYEFQTPASVISYAWLQQYGLPTDGSADYADSDGDGMNNWQEWRCGTNPTNVLSALRLLPAFPTGTNVTVTWQSVVGVSYFLERTMNLSAPVVFAPVATSIPGQPGTTTYTDTTATGPGPFFYRVGISSP